MYVPFRSLSISKFSCTNAGAGQLVLFLPLGVVGRGGAGELVLFLPLAVARWLNSRPHKLNPLKTQTGVTQLMYKKLPMYRFFIWRLYLVSFMRDTSILGALEGVGMKISTVCRPNGPRFARAIWAPTGLDFHTHPF